MKALSRVVQNMPAGATVAWNADHTRITVQSHTVIISKYVEQVQQSLLFLSHMLDEKILFGIEFRVMSTISRPQG